MLSTLLRREIRGSHVVHCGGVKQLSLPQVYEEHLAFGDAAYVLVGGNLKPDVTYKVLPVSSVQQATPRISALSNVERAVTVFPNHKESPTAAVRSDA